MLVPSATYMQNAATIIAPARSSLLHGDLTALLLDILVSSRLFAVVLRRWHGSRLKNAQSIVPLTL